MPKDPCSHVTVYVEAAGKQFVLYENDVWALDPADAVACAMGIVRADYPAPSIAAISKIKVKSVMRERNS